MATEKRIETNTIPILSQTERVWVLLINIFIGFSVYALATGSYFPGGSGASVWLLAMITHWVLTLVAAPFFLPPRDSLSTAISTILLIVPVDLTAALGARSELSYLIWFSVAFSLLIGVMAVISIFRQSNSSNPFNQICYRLSSTLGKGEILLTPAVVVSTMGFYQDKPGWMMAIISLWIFMVTVKPVELFLRIWVDLRNHEIQK